MPSILDALTSVLGQGDTFTKLGSLMGADAGQAEEGVRAAGPTILSALAENAGADEGAEPIAELVDSVGPSILDDVDGYLDQGDTEVGTGVLDFLFSKDRRALLGGLSSDGNVSSDSYGELLPRLAPLVLGAVAERKAEDDLDSAGLASLLGEERAVHEKDGDLGDWFTGAISGGGAMAAVAGLAVLAKDRLGGAVGLVGEVAGDAADLVEDAIETVGDKVDEAAEAVSDLSFGFVGMTSDALSKVTAKLSAGVDALTGKDEAEDTSNGDDGNGDGDGEEKDDGDSASAAAGAAVIGSTTGNGSGDTAESGGADRRGLGWFWWAVGAVALILFLAWLLTQLSDDVDDAGDPGGASTIVTEPDSGSEGDGSGDDTEADTGTDASEADTGTDASEADDAASAAMAAAVDAALADAGFGDSVAVSIAGDVVTLSGSVGSEDDRAAAEAAVAAVDGVGRVDNGIEVEEADDAASAAMAAAVDAALADAGFGDSVAVSIAGDVVTLSGSVGSQDDRAAAEAAVMAVDGVGSVDNGIEVGEPDDAAAMAPGMSLNEELGLAPITFEYRSAIITADGEGVLTEVIAYLEANAIDLEIQGHTDNDGSIAENVLLGQRRADAVRAHLEANGIDAGRLSAVGIGEADPLVPNDSLDNKAINRRIELIVAG